MTDALLIFGDTDRSLDMFHSVPLGIIDPFLYAEVDGRRVAVNGVLEADRLAQAGVEVIDFEQLGRHELVEAGMHYDDIDIELAVRGCERLGITAARVPPDFWAAVADRLRAAGVEVTVDRELFAERRRVKTPHQLAGIRRAQAAADEAMAEAARLLREARDGLTCEAIRAAMQEVCRAHGSDLADDVIVAAREQSASGHESGSGPIRRGDLVLIDIWPRDRGSRCFADMTRTFVAGGAEPAQELVEYHRLCRDALDAVMPAIRPGAIGREIYDLSADVFERAGHPTQRTKTPGEVLAEGYYHGLGHGVGLSVHEPPGLGRSGHERLVAGDVVTVEPGCYRRGFGGCRLEDLVLVTDDGPELLTDFPYDLAP